MIKNNAYDRLIVSSAPHLLSKMDTRKVMLYVILSLIPSLAVSTYVFGARALTLTVACVAFCVILEYLFNVVTKREQTVQDLSAVVTGILLAFNLPSNFPFTLAFVGCLVAIIVVKQLFGGVGKNLVNPAIAARVVLLVSFPSQMTSWPVPRGSELDTLTGPTPLGILKEGGGELASNGDLFFGFVGGSLGEVSAIALLIGFAFLLYKKVVSPLIPVCYMGTVVLIALAAGVDPIFHLCAGGVVLGACFMATDYVTSPMLPLGKIIFAIGCGAMTMAIRLFGSYPEGVSFAILFMNVLVPHIDNLCMKLVLRGGGKK